MAHLLTIPKLGLTMTDCTLVEWVKQDGDKVEKGEVLYVIETEKISSEIEADASGYLRRFAVTDTTHDVGAVVGALFQTPADALSAVATDVHQNPAPVQGEASVSGPVAPAQSAAISPETSRLRVSPLARRIAAGAGIDAASLKGTGSQGAVLRRDVDTEIARLEAVSREDASLGAPADVVLHVVDVRRPLSGIRRAISQKMAHSLHTTAQMTGFGRIDMTEAVRLRTACVDAEAELGVRVTYTDIVLKACADALEAMPEINASIIGDEIVTWGDVNVGLAVALDDGLIVPVIRNANRKSIAEIAHERRDLAARARAGRLGREDVEGGTFSLSNFGSYGGDFETPILNTPQSAILGIGAISDEPVVREGQIVIRPMMMMSLTFDHRLIDGAVAGRFRARVRTALETPYSQMAVMR